jgi:hypothetical protein
MAIAIKRTPQVYRRYAWQVMPLRTLEEVLEWCRAHDADVVEVIVQDEFTHDVVVRTVNGEQFHVFDTT